MRTLVVSLALCAALGLAGCGDDTTTAPTTSTLKVNLTGLEDLGANAQYEGWVMVNGQPKSTGVFTVNAAGAMSKTEFAVASADLSAATAFVLTIEPKPDADPMPSKVHLVAGDFSGSSASLTVGHSSAIGNNFASAAGKYILATPTDGMNTNEKSGVWFIDNSTGSMMPGLGLPTLPEGWKYEGWSVMNGTPVTTGTFSTVNMADEAKPFSGPQPGPPFPGEDYLMNAPAGLSFPTDLSGTMTVVTIEPVPDNSAMPFLLKPLKGTVPSGAAPMTVYQMQNQASTFPTGTATR